MTDDNEAWTTIYDVRMSAKQVEDGDLGSYITHEFHVVDKITGTVQGIYRDYFYARKQAKRKYKKLTRSIEKAFMS